MDIAGIFGLIERGLTIANTLIDAGKSARPAIEVLLGVTQAQQQSGGVTDEQLNQFESQLDALIEDFNKPMD